MNLRINYPDPLYEARRYFIDELIDLRDNTVELAAASSSSPESLGHATLLVNHAIEGVLAIIDGNSRPDTGYLLLPKHMVESNQHFHNLAGDLAPVFRDMFDVINLR